MIIKKCKKVSIKKKYIYLNLKKKIISIRKIKNKKKQIKYINQRKEKKSFLRSTDRSIIKKTLSIASLFFLIIIIAIIYCNFNRYYFHYHI
jgi:Trk-type K+ transport system membrane component